MMNTISYLLPVLWITLFCVFAFVYSNIKRIGDVFNAMFYGRIRAIPVEIGAYIIRLVASAIICILGWFSLIIIWYGSDFMTWLGF